MPEVRWPRQSHSAWGCVRHSRPQPIARRPGAAWRVGCPAGPCAGHYSLMPGRRAAGSRCSVSFRGLDAPTLVHWALLLSTGMYCNGTFDQYVCWPHSSPGNVSVPCPPYLPWWSEGNVFFYHFVTVSLKAGPTRQGAVRETAPAKCFSCLFLPRKISFQLSVIPIPLLSASPIFLHLFCAGCLVIRVPFAVE